MTGASPAPLTIGVIGLGEAGRLIATDLAAAGAIVHGYDPAVAAAPALEAAGVQLHTEPTGAVRGVDVVLSVNASAAAVAVATSCLPALSRAIVYADANTGSPDLKKQLAELVEPTGARFVDVALMTPVPGHGLLTPMLAAGSGAERFAALFGSVGATVEVVGVVPGDAAAKKLLRSLYAKGLAAVVIDALWAARALGHEDWLRHEIEADLDAAGSATVERLLTGTATHAGRRQLEVQEAIEMLAEVGHETILAPAAQRLIAQIAEGRPVAAPGGAPPPTD